MVVDSPRCCSNRSRCGRSKSNHRCCYNARYRNKRTRQVSDSSTSSSISSTDSVRKRSSSSGKTSSGYGCSDPKRSRLHQDSKRRRRSSHVSHKSNLATGTSKATRASGDRVRSRDSSARYNRPDAERSCANFPPKAYSPHSIKRRRSRSGRHSSGHSTHGRVRNGLPTTISGVERVDISRAKREKREQKRRDEKSRRKASHEGHKRKPSPVVAVGDVIKRRYRVQKIIGEGSYGQVFECFDLCTNSLTAVKALKPQDDYKDVAKHELNVLEKISRLDAKGYSHCISSLDFFDWHSYFFLVFPLLGPSVFSFLEQNNYVPYPVEQSAAIIRQVCESVEFLHSIGITHTDLKPENILFVDGAFEEVYSDDRHRTVRQIKCPKIKVIDFGSATFDGDRHSTTIQTRHYRAPEVVMELGWDKSADVWSIGCILFELLTGQCLFMTHDNLEHMAMMERLLGPLPKTMVKASRRRRYFRRGRLDWSSDSSEARHVRKVLKPLGDYWFSFSDMSVRLAFDLIREMLLYIPSSRITCSKALEHPFLLSFDS